MQPERGEPVVATGWTVGWRGIRIVLGLAYLAWLADRVIGDGVPTGRRELTLIVVVGLGIWSLGRGWRRMVQVIVDWLPFTVVLMCYDSSRAIADTMGMPLHERDIEQAERWLFGGVNPTIWMQEHLYDPAHVHWYDALATLTYTSHFVVTPLLAAIFWTRARPLFLRYVARVIVLSFAGLATYILFPEAPPWLAGQDGYLPPVARLSARGWEYLHAGFANRLLVAGQNGGANPVAAMPSLHLAFAVLAALFLAERLRSRWRILLFAYPVLMGASLVYTGEHYVIDLIFGALYAVAVHWALRRAEAWWRARKAVRGGPEPAPAAPAVAGVTADI